MLKQLRCFDLDDNEADIELVFFSNDITTEALGAAATKYTFAGGAQTDTLVEQNNPLGGILVDVTGGTAGTVASKQDGVYWELLDYTGCRIHIVRNLNFPVNTGNLTSSGTSTPSSIYFMGIATETKTYTASGLIFEFTFEY